MIIDELRDEIFLVRLVVALDDCGSSVEQSGVATAEMAAVSQLEFRPQLTPGEVTAAEGIGFGPQNGISSSGSMGVGVGGGSGRTIFGGVSGARTIVFRLVLKSSFRTSRWN